VLNILFTILCLQGYKDWTCFSLNGDNGTTARRNILCRCFKESFRVFHKSIGSHNRLSDRIKFPISISISVSLNIVYSRMHSNALFTSRSTNIPHPLCNEYHIFTIPLLNSILYHVVLTSLIHNSFDIVIIQTNIGHWISTPRVSIDPTFDSLFFCLLPQLTVQSLLILDLSRKQVKFWHWKWDARLLPYRLAKQPRISAFLNPGYHEVPEGCCPM